MDKIAQYLQYDFVKYAFLVGLLVALCSSIIGSVVVTKRMAFVGDGISHVAFGATAIASVLGLTGNMVIVLPVTILTSLLLLKNTESKKTPNDALLAVISIWGLVAGYLSLNLFSKSANVSGDVCGFLFGATSILTLTKSKVVACCILSAVVIALFVIFYNKIYAVTFDETFSKVSGVKKSAYKALIAVMIDVVIVISIELVGALLTSALIILPTLSAMRHCKSFKGVIIISAIYSLAGTTAGLVTSILAGTPVGCTIVAIDIVLFVLSWVTSLIKIKR